MERKNSGNLGSAPINYSPRTVDTRTGERTVGISGTHSWIREITKENEEVGPGEAWLANGNHCWGRYRKVSWRCISPASHLRLPLSIALCSEPSWGRAKRGSDMNPPGKHFLTAVWFHRSRGQEGGSVSNASLAEANPK